MQPLLPYLERHWALEWALIIERIDRNATLNSFFKGIFLYYLTVSKPHSPLNRSTDCLLPLLLQTKLAFQPKAYHNSKKGTWLVLYLHCIHIGQTNWKRVKSTHLTRARSWTPSHKGSVNCNELVPTYVQQQESFKAQEDRKFSRHRGLLLILLLPGEHRLHWLVSKSLLRDV